MDLVTHLEREEGYRRSAYEDHLGYLTIGIGRLIDERKDGGITLREARYLLANDIEEKEAQLDKLIPWWRRLSQIRRLALTSMAFQLGVTGLLQFKNMIHALRMTDYEVAAREALNSRWARQTPERAQRVAAMLRDETISS